MKPVPAPSLFPYHEHRTMAQVLREEHAFSSCEAALDRECPICAAKPGEVCHHTSGLHAERRMA